MMKHTRFGVVVRAERWARKGLMLYACAFGIFGAASVHAQTDEPIVRFFVRDGESVAMTQQDFREWFDISTQLVYDASYQSMLENTESFRPALCPMTHDGCAFLMPTRTDTQHIRKVQRVELREEDVRRFLTRLADDLRVEPVDARFRMQDGRVTAFRTETEGYELMVEESVSVIAQYADGVEQGMMPGSLKLPARTLKPTFTIEDINNLGIKEVIGEGRSNFAGSPGTRIHNIKTAASKFNGVILAPGEELSFVNLLGPVDGTTGYVQELVIKDNKTQPEYGGGVCQVSTTLFRSAIYTGLEVTQRRNHSYPVKYYEPVGFDATIYIPNPDLKFKNNTDHHILFENFIEGTELVFRVYGTKDGRSVEMVGPIVTEKNPDGSMKTYFTQKVIAADGTTMIDDVFYSNYKSPNDYPIQRDVAN